MKFSKYNIPVETDKGIVLYNTNNSGYVNIFNEPELSEFRELLKQKELPEDNKIVNALYQRGYVVDDNMDEYEKAKIDIKNFLIEDKKSIYVVLYVTDNCNFRCIYCPQIHNPKVFSDNNWEALYKYFAKNYIAISSEAKLHKCEYVYFKTVEPVGYLSDSGDFVFNEKYTSWTDIPETENCPECIIYSLCAARYCIKDCANGTFDHEYCIKQPQQAVEYIKESIRNGILCESQEF